MEEVKKEQGNRNKIPGLLALVSAIRRWYKDKQTHFIPYRVYEEDSSHISIGEEDEDY